MQKVDVTVTVNKQLLKYRNYFLKVAKEDRNKDLTPLLEKIGVDTTKNGILLFPILDKIISVVAEGYDAETSKFHTYKASVSTC